MDINTESKKYELTVTVDDYFNILKSINPLTPMQISQKQRFESFLLECENNSQTISEVCRDICSEYRKKLAKLYSKENITPLEKEAMDNYEKRMSDRKDTIEEIGSGRILLKGGYIDATIILVLLLNIGFIIAMALLGSK